MKWIAVIALALAATVGSAVAQSDRGGNGSGAGTIGSPDGGAGIPRGSGTGHSDTSRKTTSSPDNTRASGDQVIDREDKILQRKLHSICRGC